MPERKEFTVPEAAEYLGVSPKDIRGYIAHGELPAWNKAENNDTTRPRYRVSVSDLDEFKRLRRVRPAVKPSPTPRRRFQMADIY